MKRLLLLFLLIFIFQMFLFGSAVQVESGMSGFQTSTGLPSSGYKLYTYEIGTTTQKTTWSDRAKVVANTNPIILDSKGRAVIFADGMYDFVLKTSEDVTDQTWESVNYRSLGESLELIDGSGVSQVYFTADGGVSYVKGGDFGVGTATPTTILHISDTSPAIRIKDTSEGIDIDIKLASGYFEIKTVSGVTVESLLKVPAALDEAPSGFLATPVGTIQMYAGATAPTAWLLCQGQALNATANPKYAPLYAVIGITYGGTGIAAFNVPDFQNRYARGVGTSERGDTVNQLTKLPTNAFTDAATGIQSASHTHSGTTSGQSVTHTHSIDCGSSGTIPGSNVATNAGSGQPISTGNASADHTHTVTTGNQSASHTHTVTIDGGGDAETRPNSVVVNYIIYTGTKY